jgi:hypothetical protein
LYVTISGAFNPDGSSVTSKHTLSMEESLGAIKPQQLQALKDLHGATCAETQVCAPPITLRGSSLVHTGSPHVRGGARSPDVRM